MNAASQAQHQNITEATAARHGWTDLTALFSSTIWHEMRHHFELADDLHDMPGVKQQVKWYLAHPKTLEKCVTHAGPYLHYVMQQIEDRHLPAELALIPMVESAYDPFVHSWVGATGIWQMMPGTASGLGLKINWWYDGRRDINASTKAALNYLTYLHHFFADDWLLAIAAYDSGEGRIQHAIENNRKHNRSMELWSLALPKETQSYVPKLLALREIVAHPEKYNVELPPIANEPFMSPVDVGHQIDFATAAKLSGVDVATLRKLNPGFRRWATAPNGPHILMVPNDHSAQFIANLTKHELLHPKAHVTWQHYYVHPGDTLASIAHKFHTKPIIIKQINGIKDPKKLRIGKRLMIPDSLALNHTHLTMLHHPANAVSEDILPGPQQRHHTVKRHDTLRRIAHQFGVKPQEIRFWNHLGRKEPLHIGQHLVIWKHHRYTHTPKTKHVTVRKGDTLGSIAHRNHTTITHLKKRNHLHGSLIKIGQKLIV